LTKGYTGESSLTTIRLAGETLASLEVHLRDAYPEETGTFALISEVRLGAPESDIVVRGLVLPSPLDWASKGDDWLTPTTAYINRAVVSASRIGVGLAFVHSHPSPEHPTGLSGIDEISTAKLFGNLSSILGAVPLASLVFTPTTFAGVARGSAAGASLSRVDRLQVVGPSLRTISAADSPLQPAEWSIPRAHDRQALALGIEGQHALGKLCVGIVGAGGTGSSVGEQLARMGVRKFIVIDDDLLVPSNVTRVYGSTPYDGRRRHPKVKIMARNLKKVGKGISVDAHERSVVEAGVAELLLQADVVFCCTDTDGSRASLNDLSMRYLIPVIDTGCRLDVLDGSLKGEYGRVRCVRPGLPCLWCTSTIDGTRILQESLSTAERKSLAASGYGSGLGPQPSVIHLTTLVASLAVSEFLSFTLGVPGPHDGCWVSLSLLDPFLRRVESAVDPSCRCQSLIGLGAAGKVV
jgi:molybdopterin/thiamine biosynthesis adenylyltransferase